MFTYQSPIEAKIVSFYPTQMQSPFFWGKANKGLKQPKEFLTPPNLAKESWYYDLPIFVLHLSIMPKKG